MTGHRMSILPIAQFCGQAPILSAQYGAGRAAAMSTAFHVRCESGSSPKSQALYALLSDLERAEVDSWQFPANVIYADGCALDYQSAEKELAVGLDDWGYYADPSEDCLSVGHLDMAWTRDVGGMKCAFIGDIKKSVWTTADGPDSLQLQAYGWAYAQKTGCEAFATGLWIATDGEWLWSKEMVVLDSERGRAIWERIFHAASNASKEFATGQHCRSCWARLHCPEYVLPAAAAQTWLAPVAAGQVPTAESAGEMVLRLQAAEDVLDKAKKNIQEWIRRGELHIVHPETGKVYVPVEMKGRESVDAAKLKSELGAKADHFLKRGAPFTQFRWVNAK